MEVAKWNSKGGFEKLEEKLEKKMEKMEEKMVAESRSSKDDFDWGGFLIFSVSYALGFLANYVTSRH